MGKIVRKQLPARAEQRSDEQADEGRSGLPRQLEHCHEVADKQGYRITWDMVLADDASGFEFRNRPALNRLLRELSKDTRQADVDRATRRSTG